MLWHEGGDALPVTVEVRLGPGRPSGLLERATKTPFTSRALGTILHVLAKHG